ncbi:MAG: tetratricopeptide repeat protein [Prosthecobacter sp.]
MTPPAVPPPPPAPPFGEPPSRRGMSVGRILLAVGIAVPMVAMLGSLAVSQFQRIREGAGQMKAQQPPVEPPPPLTAQQQEALELFGANLAEAISRKDSVAVKAAQDSDGLATRVFEQLPPMPDAAKIRAGFIRGASNREGGWMWSLMAGEAAFLRTRERLGFPAVLLRMKTEAGAVSYVDVLVRPEGISFRAVDMFNYIFATTTSEEARNVLAVLTAKSGMGGLAALLGIPQMKMDEDVAARFEAINKAKQAGDPAEVLRICDSLPAELKTQRTFFILRLQALMELSSTGNEKIDEDYQHALRAAPDILGKGSTTDLLMVDLLFLENDFQAADDCLKRVDAVVGGDPYLKFLRGSARLQLKDYEGALALANEAQQEDPQMPDAVNLRIGVHLARKDHKAVVGEFRTFRKNFGVTLDREALSGEDVYKDFLASPEFAIWEKEIAAP